ncbi:MAG: hydantoinase B/oxoprolinase family protein, partial [Cyclobacteriaceae bacterium]
MNWHLNIDTGGTFTDCIARDPYGKIRRLKILSNSTLRGTVMSKTGINSYRVSMNIPCETDIFNGYVIRPLGESKGVKINKLEPVSGILDTKAPLPDNVGDIELVSPEEVPMFAARILTETPLNGKMPAIHLRLGTTRATNALLERKGAKVILITTSGFGDILRIGNQQRPDLFSLEIKTPDPLYENVYEIEERLDASGKIIEPISYEKLHKLLDEIKEDYASTDDLSIAICLLHSYRNSDHEHEIRQFLKKNGFAYISCSSDISQNARFLDRTETTVVNAYLKPIMDQYLGDISKAADGNFYIMTSSGHLTDMARFLPKDSLLSGPAGGVAGAAHSGHKENEDRILSFDMGGTSTDVALYNDDFSYTYMTRVGPARIQAASLDINTIAAGGGSICSYDGHIFHVGPKSAGASPGPACYGAGGPLTISDVNLLSGRLVTDAFNIPVSADASLQAVARILKELQDTNLENILQSFQLIANERMAETIRKTALKDGIDASELTLVSFGGAGGQHACDIAELLNTSRIIIPYNAGLLSADGIAEADVAHFEMKEIFEPWKDVKNDLQHHVISVNKAAIRQLVSSGYQKQEIEVRNTFLYLRFSGQETSLEIEYTENTDVEKQFGKAYRNLYGHWLDDQDLELVSIKSLAVLKKEHADEEEKDVYDKYNPEPLRMEKSLHSGEWIETPKSRSENSTAYIKNNWIAMINQRGTLTVDKGEAGDENSGKLPESAQIRLFLNRFSSVVEEMGAILERTAFSVNIKERYDFSCALLDRNCSLIVNAPHIPVHLGSMGLCVSEVVKKLQLNEGDIAITNHPAYGGSHLPDVTLIAPVYDGNTLVGYVANRAHHAEIGGKTPGSMPPDARRLIEEGVIISPVKLVDAGEPQWEKIASIFREAPFPTRALQENLADLRGSIASIQAGVKALKALCSTYGRDHVQSYMKGLSDYVSKKFDEARSSLERGEFNAEEYLDDGNKLQVRILNNGGPLLIDFKGTSPVHPGNFNATPAI